MRWLLLFDELQALGGVMLLIKNQEGLKEGNAPVDKLFSEIAINGISLHNRIVMPPMALAAASETGQVTQAQLGHYGLRARRYPVDSSGNSKKNIGVGMVLVEHCYVNEDGKAHTGQLGIDQNDKISGLRDLAEAIHKEGAIAGLQISHAGARGITNPKAPTAMHIPFLYRPSPSAETPGPEAVGFREQLEREEIEEIIEDFARAAWRAKEAGFDLVEIHGAHGYLLNQFYSPLTNKRSDKYGGSVDKRLRLALEVVQVVRRAVGPHYPVIYRLGADDRQVGGTNLQDSCIAAPLLVEAGVDCLDLSGGICGYLKDGPEGFFLYLADAIKPTVDVPILVAGGIKTAKFAAQAIEVGKVDMVGIGRSLLLDPQWCRKVWASIYKLDS
ncbi:MAG TPA: NADH:flavin oxidoreductase [Syntrophomonadaceae bacterium]|nr:NADH:flavin oxidoreductase [Syntrophomonadaceae bacterium]